MAMTLQQAVEAVRKARYEKARAAAARKDLEEKLKLAVEEDRAAGTAADQAHANLAFVVRDLTEPGEIK